MKVIETKLRDCYIIEPDVFGDNRGYFMETHNLQRLKDVGINVNFVQANESFTERKNTIRGLHFQAMPHTQAKLVRCPEGAIYDVAVDLRKSSPTYKEWIKVELSKDNKRQLYLPRGFAHGFLTLTDNVRFCYEVDNYYNKESDGGILWSDPEIGVDWGVEDPILSHKDKLQPVLSKSKANF
ncbi:MAG: dTDP-4-dehydrorhamnose 3,5-epimerase [Bacilli bacterium]|nr:dTDP-4-dehydrorhamnose 3,5-epimerase [Bacilli bacterium]